VSSKSSGMVPGAAASHDLRAPHSMILGTLKNRPSRGALASNSSTAGSLRTRSSRKGVSSSTMCAVVHPACPVLQLLEVRQDVVELVGKRSLLRCVEPSRRATRCVDLLRVIAMGEAVTQGAVPSTNLPRATAAAFEAHIRWSRM